VRVEQEHEPVIRSPENLFLGRRRVVVEALPVLNAKLAALAAVL
jgi:hypothetical protein